jgi:hypothetical protein
MKTTTNTDQNQRQVIGTFLDRFHISVHVDDFCNEGIVVTDQGGHRVAPAYGEIREGVVHTGEPYADIMVIGLKGGVLAGWVHADALKDAGDRFLVPVKSLNKMPSQFNFIQECPHLSVYGGVNTEDRKGWECLGCGQVIILR